MPVSFCFPQTITATARITRKLIFFQVVLNYSLSPKSNLVIDENKTLQFIIDIQYIYVYLRHALIKWFAMLYI